MNRTRVERIPLHSCATSITIPGSLKTSPSRSTGVGETPNIKEAASAEEYWKNTSIACSTKVGKGTTKKSIVTGKANDRIADLPKKANANPITMQTKLSMVMHR